MKNFRITYATKIFIAVLASVIFFSPVVFAENQSETEEVSDLSLGDLLKLDVSLVTATKRQISLRKAPAIATVITGDEIKNMGARNLKDVLKMVPGFGHSINEYARDMFEVRGIKTTVSEKILLMLDGHRLNDPFSGSALFFIYDELSVEKIRQVEIIRGPGSALYGANAFVAVINVITKDADDTDSVEASLAAGNFDTKIISVHGGRAVDDNLKIFGSIAYSDTRGTDVTIEADSLSATPYSAAPGDAEMSLEKKEAFLKISYGDLMFRGHFLENIEQGTYIGIANALTDENSFFNTQFWTELNYAKSLTEKLSGSFRAYFDQFRSKADWEILPEGYPKYPDGMIGRPSLKARTFGTEFQFDFDMSESNHMIAGVSYEHIKQYEVVSHANFNPWNSEPLGSVQNVSSWGNFNKDVTRKVWAVYLQDEWELGDNLNLTAGVRYDNYDDFGSTVNPRAGVVWNFLKNADLKLLYGQAFRAPSFQELYNDGNPNIIGNPDLDPETIRTYEASLGCRFGNSHMMNVNYFFNDIDDLIVIDTSTKPGRNLNKGGAEIDGVEFVMQGRYSPASYWKLAYTYQNAKDADTDEDLPNVPSHRAVFSVNYEVCKYLNAHADILWTDKRPRISGDPRDDMPSYSTVDLTLTAKNIYKGFEIRGMVHNLFDEKYEDPDLSGPARAIPGDYPREGISGLIEISYRF